MIVPADVGSAYRPGGILFVGRDPGAEEEKQGRPFAPRERGGVHNAGTLLESAMTKAGLRRKDVIVTNVVTIRPPGNDFHRHDPEQVRTGLDNLYSLVQRLKPNVVVALGNEASYALVPDWPSKTSTIYGATGILDRRGYWWWNPMLDVKVLTTIHPASLLHLQGEEAEEGTSIGANAAIGRALLARDLLRAKQEADRGPTLVRPRREIEVVTTPKRASLAADRIMNVQVAACDIETDNLHEVSCIGFATSPEQAYVFTPAVFTQPALILRSPGVRILFHNGLFDDYVLRTRLGIEVANWTDDTMVLFHCLWPEMAGQGEGNKRTHKSLQFLASLYTKDEWWKCVAPWTKVLMADLSWKEIRYVETGEEVLAFDEFPIEQGKRRWRRVKVLGKKLSNHPRTIVLVTKHGSICVTPEHRLLVKTRGSRESWMRADQIRPGMSLRWVSSPTEVNTSRDAGWLAGMCDGEGSIRVDRETNSGGAIAVAQKEGPELDRVLSAMKSLGFDGVKHQRKSQVSVAYVRGGRAEWLRFLGKIRPERLIRNFVSMLVGHVFSTTPQEVISEIISFREGQEMVDIATESGTFIANGFAVHNCYDFADDHEMYHLNGMDCCVTLDCYYGIQQEYGEMQIPSRIYDHEMRLVRTLSQIQDRGILVDEALRSRAGAMLDARQQEQEAETAEVIRQVLHEKRDKLSRPSLFWTRKVCRSCRNGKKKRLTCPECEGKGEFETFHFNADSPDQKKILLYEALGLPKRYHDGKLTTREDKLKDLLGGLS